LFSTLLNTSQHFSTLLDDVDDLVDVVVTAGALHAQTGHAEYLHKRGAHCVLTVKGNQKTLRDQLAGLPWTEVPDGHHETDSSHGRRVTRTYKVVTIAAGIGFPHAAQAVRIHPYPQTQGQYQTSHT
jgi:hypothetical protein